MLKKLHTYLQRFNSNLIKMSESLLKPISLGKRSLETDDDKTSQKKSKKKKTHVVSLGQSEGCKRKIAMLVAYNGAGYYGVQINPGFPTIESEFFPALVKIGAIPQDHADTPSKMWFQRGSRTDKGVSAAVLVPDLISKLNEVLPSQIRAIGYIRTTNGYDSKNWCDSRTYMYMTPTFAFAPLEKFITDDYRTSPEILDRIREVLSRFLGTHKFHNFTSGVKFEQACASRYIMKFECSEPYVRDNIEFITLRVKGQSFMLHHIRKMIGLTIAILRGYCGESTIDACWGPDKVDIPKAPGLGLVLEELHFDGYNKKFGKDGVHDCIDWSGYKDDIERFKEEQIIATIVVEEKKNRIMFNWLRTLQFHNFGHPRPDAPEKPWGRTNKILNGKAQADDFSQDLSKDSDTLRVTNQAAETEQMIFTDALICKECEPISVQPCTTNSNSENNDSREVLDNVQVNDVQVQESSLGVQTLLSENADNNLIRISKTQ